MTDQVILNYWLGSITSKEDIAKEKQSIWFRGGEAIDCEIKEKFGELLSQAEEGKLDHWANNVKGHLALIILLDQFSRNIYRDIATAYKNDSKSLDLCLRGIEQKIDQTLFPIEIQFLYMPLQHSEDLVVQEKSVAMFQKLYNESPKSTSSYFQQVVQSAERHKEIIEMFGRFPHRNNILNRESTQQEIEFLQTPNSSF